MESVAFQGAAIVSAAFDAYQARFQEITRRACRRFEERDWHGMQQDAVERLEIREQIIHGVVLQVQTLLAAQVRDKLLWAQMKTAYVESINSRPNPQLAETFFSSVTRRIFATEGVDPNIEFVDSEFDGEGPPPAGPVFAHYSGDTPAEMVRQILTALDFDVPYPDVAGDARRVAERIETGWTSPTPIDRIEMLTPIFYRGKGAYLVGRIGGGEETIPLVLALNNGEYGIYVDAVMLTPDEVSIVFSFTRSYFHVEVERPREVIGFLHSIMPAKRIAELYISIGYHKHGKTELYRELIHHLSRSEDLFDIAPGERGMVMLVFTLQSFDMVVKVIRDRFAYPKTTTRQDVIDRYNLVFKHDRAGRLVDAQEFEHLKFPRARFSERLLAELTASGAGSVSTHGDDIVIKHLYAERRVTPLNLYLRESDDTAASAAVLDYGQAIKDLARANIFPGDLLLKNFGVTRHGRVIFYDYDELGWLTDYNFRDMPQPRDVAEESSDEPWFYVAPNDVFPEEFLPFLGLPADLRQVFLQIHRDLLSADFWRRMQARHRAGDVVDIFPYAQSNRLVR